MHEVSLPCVFGYVLFDVLDDETPCHREDICRAAMTGPSCGQTHLSLSHHRLEETS